MGRDSMCAIESDAMGANPNIVQRSLKSSIVVPQLPSEPASAKQILFVSSQTKQEQLLSHWSTLHETTAASLNHCQQLCKNAASPDDRVEELSKRVPRPSLASTAFATVSSERNSARAPVLIPS